MMLSAVMMMSAMYSLPYRVTMLDWTPVVGTYREALDQTVIEFLGIRYATAKRFQAPKLFKPRKLSTYDTDEDEDEEAEDNKHFKRNNNFLQSWFLAQKLGNSCPGSSQLFVNQTIATSEDCLFLNIWVKRSETFNWQADIPVVVFIHGGTYYDGSAHNFNGAKMVASSEEPVVLVSINYRQNVFGFLGSEDLRSGGTTGNWGLLDQRMALNWVRKYIHYFGGDSNQVTIWGQSAGAGSVASHLLMQKSWGLFNKAILESTYFASKTMAEAETQYTETLKLTGCNETSNTVKCLKELSTTQLVDAAVALAGRSSGPWEPTVDGDELHKLQWEAFRDGEFDTSVQVMIGTTSDEIGGFAYSPALQGATDPALFPLFTGNLVTDPAEIPELQTLYNSTRDYPTERGQFSDVVWQIVSALSDNIFFCTTRRALLSIAKYSEKPVYYYLVSYPIKSTTLFFIGNPFQVFVTHGATIPLFWNCPRYPDLWDCEWQLASDAALSLEMSRLYSRFIRTGNPGGAWLTPYSNTTDQVFVMGTPTEVGGPGFHYQTQVHKEVCEFWDRHVSLTD